MKDGLEIELRSEKMSLKNMGGDNFRYRREHNGEVVAERLFTNKDGSVRLALWPTRPINTPQPLGHHVMLRLNPAISLPPRSEDTHHLTMPIEIGISFETGADTTVRVMNDVNNQLFTFNTKYLSRR